jgi:curved DNA-binding protein CbpA
MSTVNLYDVLNLQYNCDQNQIKKSYKQLVKKYHPDKGGDPELFELITHSYNTLKKEDSRKEYDKILNISKEAEHSHTNLKESSQNYYKAQKTTIVKKSKKEVEDELKRMHLDFDNKNNYNSQDTKAFSTSDFLSRLNDLAQAREQEEIEYTPDELFDTGGFNPEQFNAVFDKMKKKKKHVNKNGTLIEQNPDLPNAWNDGSEYSSYGISYDKLYVENNTTDLAVEGDNYGVFNVDEEIIKINKDDIGEIDRAEYTLGHNVIDSDYSKNLEDLMNERQNETNKLHKMKMSEYKTETGKYGVYDSLGFDVSKSNVLFENEADVKEKYQRLLEERKHNK